MKAVTYDTFGDANVLHISEVPDPELRPDDLLVKVYATALNRADINQRKGAYGNETFGDSPLLGLEIAGKVIATGVNADPSRIGQRVMGIVGGGGYAEIARIDQHMAMPIPEGWSYETAAATPEAFITADEAVFRLGGLKPNETVLIHAGASGIGTSAIQMARYMGARVITTVGSEEKAQQVRDLGAHDVILYKDADFADRVDALTQGRGVDVIVDFIGADYFERNLASLSFGGRLVVLGLMGGAQAVLPLQQVMFKRLNIMGSVMKSRTLAEKRQLTSNFMERWHPLLQGGALGPVIDSVMPWTEVVQAHDRMQSNANTGKIVLKVR